MTIEAKAHRLIAIGREEHAHMTALARLQAERCKILREGLAEHGAKLGLDKNVAVASAVPKNEPPNPPVAP